MAYGKADWVRDRLREQSISEGELPEIKMAADESGVESSFQTSLVERTGIWELFGVWAERSPRGVRVDTSSASFRGQLPASRTGKPTALGYRYLPADEELLPFFLPLINERGKALLKTNPELLITGAVNDEGRAAGILVIKLHNEGFGEIKYLYTAESERGKGLMKGLIYCLTPLLLRAGIKKLYLILAKDRKNRADEGIEALLRSLKGESTLLTEHIVSVPAKEILKKSGKNTGKCLPLNSISPYMIKETIEDADPDIVDRLYYFIDKKDGDLKETFDSASTVIVKGESINDCLIYVPREKESGIILVYMKGQDSLSLAEMLAFSARSAIREYGENAYVTFATINGIGKAMAGLFKDDYEWVKAERADISLEALI